MTWNRFAAPVRFYGAAGAALPWLWAATGILAATGLWFSLAVAPTDATQGEAYRILFIHVPAAWMAMIVYLAMAFWAVWGWMLNARMASMYARALAPTGALMTLLMGSDLLEDRPLEAGEHPEPDEHQEDRHGGTGPDVDPVDTPLEEPAAVQRQHPVQGVEGEHDTQRVGHRVGAVQHG